MAGRDFVAAAQARRFSQGRKHAEAAIEMALMACEAREASDEQLADLADAVDAFRAGQYSVAVTLAEAAIERRHTPQATAIRPLEMRRSLVDLKAMLAEIAKAEAAEKS